MNKKITNLGYTKIEYSKTEVINTDYTLEIRKKRNEDDRFRSKSEKNNE